MAGALTVSTLNNDTGVLATQNGMTGIAKAWVNFNGGSGNTGGAINGSFNVSSVTNTSTGRFTVNFSTAMANANYVISASGTWENTNPNGTSGCGTYSGASNSTTQTFVQTVNPANQVLFAPVRVYVAIFGA